MASSTHNTTPIGQMALHTALGLDRPLPAVQSYVVAGARRTVAAAASSEEFYPPPYATDGSLTENLRFALKHEALDLGVVYEALRALGPAGVQAWVNAEPTGQYSRRAWFLYETLTGDELDLPQAATGNYVDALDERRHVVAAPRNSRRHRVRDNLLGNQHLCPTLRRTPRLEQMIAQGLADEAQALTAGYDPDTLARAVSFLYTKETRSSFAIEGEAPSSQREARFLQALHRLDEFNPGDQGDLVRLQQSIVDPRYAAHGWRTVQNFVSETTRGFGQQVDFVCPRPQDVPGLMQGWQELTRRVLSSPVDPVLAASLSAFAFVFIHPFEDGNGRLHRFLIHHVLARRGFTPPGVVFPISAAILRQRHLYDQALDGFSAGILPSIAWRWTAESELVVENETRDLYRFFDATSVAEYLYDRVAETIRIDLKEELGFLEAYDAAYRAVTSVVDLPNQRAALLTRLLLQNHGRLSRAKRRLFGELTEEEVAAMELAVQAMVGQFGAAEELSEES